MVLTHPNRAHRIKFGRKQETMRPLADLQGCSATTAVLHYNAGYRPDGRYITAFVPATASGYGAARWVSK